MLILGRGRGGGEDRFDVGGGIFGKLRNGGGGHCRRLERKMQEGKGREEGDGERRGGRWDGIYANPCPFHRDWTGDSFQTNSSQNGSEPREESASRGHHLSDPHISFWVKVCCHKVTCGPICNRPSDRPVCHTPSRARERPTVGKTSTFF